MSWPVDPQRYALFLGVMAVFAITPGPAVLFCVATGVTRGRRAAVLGVLGVDCASLVWFLAAALGVGAVMKAAPLLFRLIAWVGVAYLLWLGGRNVVRGLGRAGGDAAPVPGAALAAGRRAWLQGFGVQIVNPKIMLVFTTVLPPFLDLGRPVAPQVGLLALALVALDTVALGTYGLGGAALATRLREPANARRFALFSGALLILAAILVAIERALT